MKRHFLVLFLGISLSGSGILTSCKEKTTEKEATTVKTETAPAATTTPAATAPDSVVATETPATASEPTPAAAQKFGYINSADLIKIMPETRRAEANLEAYVKTLEKQFTGLQTDYQRRIADFQAQEKTMIDAIKETKIRDLQTLEQRMQQSQASGQQQVALKREQLFKPILDKAEKAIKDVGKENGYDYVFDTNTGSFVYAKESHNIMPLVKAKLGLK